MSIFYYQKKEQKQNHHAWLQNKASCNRHISDIRMNPLPRLKERKTPKSRRKANSADFPLSGEWNPGVVNTRTRITKTQKQEIGKLTMHLRNQVYLQNISELHKQSS